MPKKMKLHNEYWRFHGNPIVNETGWVARADQTHHEEMQKILDDRKKINELFKNIITENINKICENIINDFYIFSHLQFTNISSVRVRFNIINILRILYKYDYKAFNDDMIKHINKLKKTKPKYLTNPDHKYFTKDYFYLYENGWYKVIETNPKLIINCDGNTSEVNNDEISDRWYSHTNYLNKLLDKYNMYMLNDKFATHEIAKAEESSRKEIEKRATRKEIASWRGNPNNPNLKSK